MVIGSSGNVSIGATDTATYKLNVNGSLNATSLNVGGTAFTSSQWVGTTDIYNITGNVGIGTSTVNERLTIRGTIGRQMMLTCTTANTSSYMGFSNSAGDGLAYIGLDGLGLTNYVYGALTLGTWKDTPILFTTGATNTEKMRIASGGNVGIGTNNPLALLDVVYSPPAVANTDMLNIRVDANWGLKVQQSYTVAGNIQYNLIHRYNTVDYNSLTFKGAFVGIGTNNPSNKLHIVHSSTAANADTAGGIGLYVYNPTNTAGNNSVIINRIGGSTAGKVLYGFDVNAAYGYSIYMLGSSSDLRFNNNWDGGGTDVMRLSNTGNLGIGTSPHATYKLDVNGTINATSVLVGGAAISGSKWTNGATATNIYYASGNVGIGTSTTSDADDNATFAIPTATLYVKGGATTGGTCDVVIRGGVAGGDNGKARLWLAADASHSSYIQSHHTGSGNTTLTFGTASGNALPAERMVINGSGNVGIGNTAPLGPLHIANGALANNDGFLILAKCTTVGTTRMFRIGLDAGFNIVIGDYGGGNTAGTWLSSFVMNYQAPANSLAIASNGYVGIGTAPSYKCHIKTSYDTVATGLHLDAGDTTDVNKYAMTIWSYVIGAGQVGWRFRTQSSTGGVCTPLTFSNAGFVGINGVTPTSALHVNGNAYVTGELRVDGGKFVINGIQPTIYFRDSNQRQGMIHVNGNLMYFLSGPTTGTTDGTDNWEQNNGQWPLYLNLTNNLASFGGNIEAVGNVSAYVSDMRLKTKTSDIKEPLDIINKLTGFYYTLNDVAKSYGFKNKKQEIGLSAQDVESVLPELVSLAPFDRKTDDDENVTSRSGNNYLTVSYDRLAPVFVEAIKELNRENIVLKKEIKELNQKNIELNEKYNKLLEDITLIKQTLNLI
jgi:hypothetical protein